MSDSQVTGHFFKRILFFINRRLFFCFGKFNLFFLANMPSAAFLTNMVIIQLLNYDNHKFRQVYCLLYPSVFIYCKNVCTCLTKLLNSDLLINWMRLLYLKDRVSYKGDMLLERSYINNPIHDIHTYNFLFHFFLSEFSYYRMGGSEGVPRSHGTP